MGQVVLLQVCGLMGSDVPQRTRTVSAGRPVLGREQKPLIRRSCCCQGEKRVRHPHPEPRAAKRVAAPCWQHPALGTRRPHTPVGSSRARGGRLGEVRALILATLRGAPARQTHGVGQKRDASPTPARLGAPR